jgi:hypothetical protein
MHYVLALAGKPRKARAEKLIGDLAKTVKGDATGEVKEQLYLLNAALFHAGDRRDEADLKNLASAADNYVQRSGLFRDELERVG